MNAMTQETALRENETLLTHYIMKAPPPSVPFEVAARFAHEGLRLKALKLDYNLILDELEKVGDGWHMRDEHTDPDQRPKTKKLLEGSRTSIWHLTRGDNHEPIGFCCAVKKGFNSELSRISTRYNAATGNPDHRVNPRNGVEVYKVGLYRDFVGAGYGHNFLPAVQAALLVGQEAVKSEGIAAIKPSEFIYLNTRLTNLVDSRNFYETLGYKYAGEDRWPVSVTEMKGIDEAVRMLPSRKLVKPRPFVQAASFSSAGPSVSGVVA